MKRTAHTLAAATALTALFAAGIAGGCSGTDDDMAPPGALRAVLQPPPAPMTPLFGRFGFAQLRLTWDESPTLRGRTDGRYLAQRIPGARLDLREDAGETGSDSRSLWLDVLLPTASPAPMFEVVAQGPEGGRSARTGSGLASLPTYLSGAGLAHPNGTPGCLPPMPISAIQPDGAGGLWIATDGGGLAHWDAGEQSWRHWTSVDGLLSDDIAALALDGHGGVWLGTPAGLQRLDAESGRTRTWPNGAGGLESGVDALAFDANGVLWMTADGGAWRLAGRMDSPVRLGGSLAEDNRSGSFMADLRNLTEHEAWEALVERYPGAGAELRAVTVAPDGAVWFAGRTGVMRQTPGSMAWRLFPLTPPGERVATPITALAAEVGSRAWVGTERGLFRLTDDGQWVDAGLPSEMNDASVTAIALRAPGVAVVVVGGQSVVCDAQRGDCRVMPPVGVTGAGATTTLAVGADGAVWQGTAHGRVERRPRPDGAGAAVDPACATAPPLHGIDSVAVAPDGAVWIASAAALARRAPETGTWSVERAEVDYPLEGLTALAFDQHGNLFAASAAGTAVRFADPPLWSVVRTEAPGSDAPAAICPAGGRKVWLGGPAGLTSLDLNTRRAASVRDERGAVLTIHDLTLGPDGGLWAATAAGLYHTAGEDVQSVPEELVGPGSVLAVAAGGPGEIWLAKEDAVKRLHLLVGSAGSCPLPKDWVGRTVVAIASAGERAVVVTRDGRVGCADAESERILERAAITLPAGTIEVNDLAVDGYGTAWIATTQLGLVAVPGVCL